MSASEGGSNHITGGKKGSSSPPSPSWALGLFLQRAVAVWLAVAAALSSAGDVTCPFLALFKSFFSRRETKNLSSSHHLSHPHQNPTPPPPLPAASLFTKASSPPSIHSNPIITFYTYPSILKLLQKQRCCPRKSALATTAPRATVVEAAQVEANLKLRKSIWPGQGALKLLPLNLGMYLLPFDLFATTTSSIKNILSRAGPSLPQLPLLW